MFECTVLGKLLSSGDLSGERRNSQKATGAQFMWLLPANQLRVLLCQACTLLAVLFCYLQKLLGEPYGASLHRTKKFCTCFYSTEAIFFLSCIFTLLENTVKVQEVSYGHNCNSRGQQPMFRHCCCICVTPVEKTTAKWQLVWLLKTRSAWFVEPSLV